MSDFIRSRGCGAPLMTAADETALRSAACTARVTAQDRAPACGCTIPVCPPTPPSCPCGGNGGGNSSEEGCGCCKASMREALRLLCSNQVSDLLDFDGFAFVTDDLMVGAQPVTMTAEAKDNLSALSGTFRRFSPCNCDLIDIAGAAYGPFGTLIDVDQATLCALSAIVFQVDESTPAPGAAATCDCLTTPEARYRRVRDLLQCELSTIDRACGECICHCNCTDDCCCSEGVLAALSGLSLNKRATLITGLLALRNVTVLGTIGNVLVLGNDDDYRFYFVCANKVEMLG